MSLTPVANLELRISPRIFEKIRNDPNGILRGLGETDSWKNQKSKISWHCRFKLFPSLPLPLTVTDIVPFMFGSLGTQKAHKRGLRWEGLTIYEDQKVVSLWASCKVKNKIINSKNIQFFKFKNASFIFSLKWGPLSLPGNWFQTFHTRKRLSCLPPIRTAVAESNRRILSHILQVAKFCWCPPFFKG